MSFARRLISAFFALALVVAPQAAAFGVVVPSPPPVYRIEGYLDRAPADAKVIDRIDVTASGRPVRWLLVTSYRSFGSVLLDRYLSRAMRHPWLVRGPADDVGRLLGAAAGARIEGTFLVYADVVPSIYVEDLDEPAA